MISFIYKVFKQSYSNYNRRFEEELDQFEESIGVYNNANKKENSVPEAQQQTFYGKITSLNEEIGIIDKINIFNLKDAFEFIDELHVGSLVQYYVEKNKNNNDLTHTNINLKQNDFKRYVKITEIIKGDWNSPFEVQNGAIRRNSSQSIKTQTNDSKRLNDIMKEVHMNSSELNGVSKRSNLFRNTSNDVKDFEIHENDIKKSQENIDPSHIENFTESLVQKTTEDGFTIKIDDTYIDCLYSQVNINFKLYCGDRILVSCSVAEQHGSSQTIKQVLSVRPIGLSEQECYTIQTINAEYGTLSRDIYFPVEIFSESISNLKVGDSVIVDMLACQKDEFLWRCFKLEVPFECHKLNLRNSKHAIYVTQDIECNITGLGSKKIVEFSVTNLSNKTLEVHNVEVKWHTVSSQVTFIDKNNNNGRFTLQKDSTEILQFEVVSKQYGITQQQIIIYGQNFRIKRSITICVGADERNTTQMAILQKNNNKYQANLKLRLLYARDVANEKNHDIIPGQHVTMERRFVAVHLERYKIPNDLQDAYLTCNTKSEMVRNIGNLCPHLNEPLTKENYARRFNTLIYMEELEQFINIRNYDMQQAIFERHGEYLSLHIADLMERRPSLVIGDSVRVTELNDAATQSRCYIGVIHKILNNKILVKFNDAIHQFYNGHIFKVQFDFSRYKYRKQHHVINNIIHKFGSEFLFPEQIILQNQLQLNVNINSKGELFNIDTGTIYEWHVKNLNIVQKRAIINILRGEVSKLPYIIYGPPGTGKTITVIEAILQLIKFIPNANIIVATPSNSAADLLSTRLLQLRQFSTDDFLRIVSFNQVERNLIPLHLLKYSATFDIGIEGTCENAMKIDDNGIRRNCKSSYVAKRRIIVGTCTTIGNMTQMLFKSGHFSHVFVDESAQCVEPDNLQPIFQLSPKNMQVILAGDPKQLEAISLSNYNNSKGFCLSLMERLLKLPLYEKNIIKFPNTNGYDQRIVTQLIYNYRSVPSILKLYNDLFYNSELKPTINENDSLQGELLNFLCECLPNSQNVTKNHGIAFYGLNGCSKQSDDSPSFYNPLEAKYVFSTIINLFRLNIKPEQIGIITPYLKQVKHIENLFEAMEIPCPKVGSVEEFQGQERDIILISTVRSRNCNVFGDIRYSLGFLTNYKRVNVALSRARSFLMIFGDPFLLKSEYNWLKCIKYCVENNTYYGIPLRNSIIEEMNLSTLQYSDIVNKPFLDNPIIVHNSVAAKILIWQKNNENNLDKGKGIQKINNEESAVQGENDQTSRNKNIKQKPGAGRGRLFEDL